MRFGLIAVVVGAAVVAGPAFAQTTETPTVPVGVTSAVVPAAGDAAQAAAPAQAPIKVTAAAKPDPKDPDAVVCKTEVNSGSRIATTKRCQTRRQWTDASRETQKMINDSVTAAANSN